MEVCPRCPSTRTGSMDGRVASAAPPPAVRPWLARMTGLALTALATSSAHAQVDGDGWSSPLIWLALPWILILAIAIGGRLSGSGALARSHLFTAFALIGRGLLVGVLALVTIYGLHQVLGLGGTGAATFTSAAGTMLYLGVTSLFALSGYGVLLLWPVVALWHRLGAQSADSRSRSRALLLFAPWPPLLLLALFVTPDGVWSTLAMILWGTLAYFSFLVTARAMWRMAFRHKR